MVFVNESHGQDDSLHVILSDSIGCEIDSTEAKRYMLFRGIDSFHKARIIQKSANKYQLDYSFIDKSSGVNYIRHKQVALSSDDLALTRSHVKMVDEYYSLRSGKTTDWSGDPEMLYALVLRYASRGRYDLASTLLSDLKSEYPESEQAIAATEFQLVTQRLDRFKKPLFWRGSLLNHDGRTDILLFSGYYGLWLGLAVPLSFDAESSQAYALGMLLGAPASIVLTSSLTRDANISEGKATMIALGGNLGTWQGLGWAGIADIEGTSIVRAGILAGLTGIGIATMLANKIDFSEGHAAVTSSGLEWGAWYGLVFAVIADHEEEDLLRDMLLGSDLFILGAGIASRNVKASESRIRLINLAGLVGTVAGFGVDLLLEVDDDATGMAIVGSGSTLGLILGALSTHKYDTGKDLAEIDSNHNMVKVTSCSNTDNWSVSPRIAYSYDKYESKLTPQLGLQINF